MPLRIQTHSDKIRIFGLQISILGVGFLIGVIPSLVGSFNHPSEKYYIVKLNHLPRDQGKNKEYLKPPPLKMCFLSKMVIFQPAMLVYQRVTAGMILQVIP